MQSLDGPEEFEPPDEERNPFREAVAREDVDEGQQLLDELKSHHPGFYALALRYYAGGVTLQDLAEEYGVPVSTIRGRLHNKVARIRKEMEHRTVSLSRS